MTSGVTIYHEASTAFSKQPKGNVPYMYVVDTDFLYKIDE